MYTKPAQPFDHPDDALVALTAATELLSIAVTSCMENPDFVPATIQACGWCKKLAKSIEQTAPLMMDLLIEEAPTSYETSFEHMYEEITKIHRCEDFLTKCGLLEVVYEVITRIDRALAAVQPHMFMIVEPVRVEPESCAVTPAESKHGDGRTAVLGAGLEVASPTETGEEEEVDLFTQMLREAKRDIDPKKLKEQLQASSSSSKTKERRVRITQRPTFKPSALPPPPPPLRSPSVSDSPAPGIQSKVQSIPSTAIPRTVSSFQHRGHLLKGQGDFGDFGDFGGSGDSGDSGDSGGGHGEGDKVPSIDRLKAEQKALLARRAKIDADMEGLRQQREQLVQEASARDASTVVKPVVRAVKPVVRAAKPVVQSVKL